MKYRINEDSIIDIIDNSELVPADEKMDERLKSILKNTMLELCRYSEDVFESIEEKVLVSYDITRIGEIVSALVLNGDRNKGKKLYYGLTEISKPGSRGEIYFLDTCYENIKSIAGDVAYEKIYEGTYIYSGVLNKFKYKLIFDDRYLWVQDVLWRMAAIYKIENMIMYSPYMRKSFTVEHLNEIPEKAQNIDYQFEKNGIPVISGADLLCNIQVEITDLLKAENKVPYGDDVKYTYYFDKSEEGNWRYPIPQNNQTIVYDVKCSDKGTEIVLDHELEEFMVVEYRKIDWESLEIKKLNKENRIFSNCVNKGSVPVRRIVSEGDIEYAIHPFRNNLNIRCQIAENIEKICTRYSAKYRNHLYNRFAYRKLKQVRLRFSTESVPFFYDDYINYVLMYLESYYPEIEWVGGW